MKTENTVNACENCKCNCDCSTPAPAQKRVKIAGNAFIITSTLKLDTIKTLEKLDKDALCVKEYFSNNEINELFRIASGKVASVGNYGITFVEADKNGNAIATMLFPTNTKDKKAYIKENFIKIFHLLNEVENQAQRAAEYFERTFKALDDIIEEI